MYEVEVNTTETDKVIDCRVALHRFIEECCICIEYRPVILQVIWEGTHNHFQLIPSKNYIELTKQANICNTCSSTFGGHAISKVESH